MPVSQSDKVMVSKLNYLHPQDHGPQIIFDALPIETAKSFIVLLIIFSIALGAVLVELINYVSFDIALIKKPGWSQPTKLLSRLAYFSCRILSPACISLVIVLLISPLKDCQAVPRAFNALGMVLIDSVALIFVQRTMALYAWKPRVSIPLAIAYCLLVISTAFCIPFYGEGFRIPNTKFCAYDTFRDRPRTLAANITFKTITMCLDLTLLVLTLHRLVDGGLRSLWLRSPRQLYADISSTRFSSFLVRQGLHFYMLQTFTEVLFVSLYYGASQLSYQVIGSALVFSVPPLVAAAAFRDMSVQATTIKTRDETRGIENVYDLQEISGDDTVTDKPIGNKQDRKKSIVGAQRDHSQLPVGLDKQASLRHTTRVRPYRSSSRVSWSTRNKLGGLTGAHQPEARNGVLVTTGTRTRSETVCVDMRQLPVCNSPQLVGQALESQTILEMQRNWPRLASRSSLVRMQTHARSESAMSTRDALRNEGRKDAVEGEIAQQTSPSLTHRPPHVTPQSDQNASDKIDD